MLSEGFTSPNVLQMAELLAYLHEQIASIRGEKAALIDRAMRQSEGNEAVDRLENSAVVCLGDDRRNLSLAHRKLTLLEAEAINMNLYGLKTLDGYETRALSRMRKARYALLLAFEASANGRGRS